MGNATCQPGAAWLEIVSRPTLQDFSSAFSANPVLEAIVLARPLVGVVAIYAFFRMTRSMYDRIAFIQAIRCATRACIEWEGVFEGAAISGATIFAFDETGAIERIRLFHFPFDQLTAFSAELARRRATAAESTNNLPGVHHENQR